MASLLEEVPAVPMETRVNALIDEALGAVLNELLKGPNEMGLTHGELRKIARTRFVGMVYGRFRQLDNEYKYKK